MIVSANLPPKSDDESRSMVDTKKHCSPCQMNVLMDRVSLAMVIFLLFAIENRQPGKINTGHRAETGER